MTSGYSVMPRRDNTFGGGNYDADDIDEWLTIQRDWQVDGGIEPVAEDELLRVRERAARGDPGGLRRTRAPAGDRRGGRGGETAHGQPRRPGSRPRDRRGSGGRASPARGLALTWRSPSTPQASRTSPRRARWMLRQRVAADYLQTAAVIEPDGLVRSAVNDPNAYLGPGTGYRLQGERWELLQALPHVVDPRTLGTGDDVAAAILAEGPTALPGDDAAEVVIALGPAFADGLRETINGLAHDDVLAALSEGVREAGATPRIVRVRRVADVGFIAHDGARLSGSGVALGIQSKGTAVIHRADLEPLDNLELFGRAPLHARELPRHGAERGRLRARAAGRACADRARQLRPREVDRPHDAPPRPRGSRRRPRRAARRGRSDPRPQPVPG